MFKMLVNYNYTFSSCEHLSDVKLSDSLEEIPTQTHFLDLLFTFV